MSIIHPSVAVSVAASLSIACLPAVADVPDSVRSTMTRIADGIGEPENAFVLASADTIGSLDRVEVFTFTQHHRGLPVDGAHVMVFVDRAADGAVLRVKSNATRIVQPIVGAMSTPVEREAVVASAMAGADWPGGRLLPDSVEPVVVVEAEGRAVEIVRVVSATAPGHITHRSEIETRTGRIRSSVPVAHAFDISGTVGGYVTDGPDNAVCEPTAFSSLPFARISVNGDSTVADADGAWSWAGSDPGPYQVASAFESDFVRIVNGVGASAAVTVDGVVDGDQVSLVHGTDDATPEILAQVNAYRFAHEFRRRVLEVRPDAGGMNPDEPWIVDTNWDVAACYAGYVPQNGQIVLGFADPESCNNASQPSVVLHEFGHLLIDYNEPVEFHGLQGGWEEGMCDVLAHLMLEDPDMAQGFRLDCDQSLRSGVNPCQHLGPDECSDCYGDGGQYGCSGVVAGAIWQSYVNMSAYDPEAATTMLDLAVDTISCKFDAWITHDVFLDFLCADLGSCEGDACSPGTLGGGTPNFRAIADGFAQHGLHLHGDVDLSGEVDFDDIITVLAVWGDGSLNDPRDADRSGSVGFGDVLQILSEYGGLVP